MLVMYVLYGAAALTPLAGVGSGTEPLEPHIGHWVGRFERQGRTYAVRLDVSRSPDGLAVTLDLPEYCLYGCPTQGDHGPEGVVLRPSLIEGTMRGAFNDDAFSGRADIIAEAANVQLRRTSREPVTYVRETVRFRSSDAELVGTLVKPPGKGPFPLIVWTHGSGPDTRATFYYHGRAHLFAQNGIASLIYDKRGAGESTGSEWWVQEKLAADALAGIAAVKARPDVDPRRIGIAGFSQGGWIAPQVAARDPQVSFVLVGATPGITGGEQNLFTLRNRLQSQGVDDATVSEATTLLRSIYEFYQTGSGYDQVARAVEEASGKGWYRDATFQGFLFLPDGKLPEGKHPYWTPFSPDPLAAWRKLRVPVFSVWGDLDANVPAGLSRERIESALKEAGNKDYKLVILPSASHGLWVVRNTESAWDWPRQAGDHHAMMVRWVTTHVRSAPPSN